MRKLKTGEYLKKGDSLDITISVCDMILGTYHAHCDLDVP